MITVQAGTYSNYVGAHLFNLQSSSASPLEAPSILWREGRSSSFSPRVLIFDTKDNVSFPFLQDQGSGPVPSSAPSTASSAAAKNNNFLWHGQVDDYTKDAKEASQSQRRAAPDFRKWTDLTRHWSWKLPSEQVHFIPNFSNNPESLEGVSYYSQGSEIWTRIAEEGENGLRKYAEEMDGLDGFNILVDQLNGYSGLVGGLLQHIADEYEKKLVIGVGICPPSLPSESDRNKTTKLFRKRVTNTALLWDAFNSHSNWFTSMGLCQDLCEMDMTPVEIPNIKYKADSFYESSAVIAAVLETLISPCVASESNFKMRDLVSFVGAMGRKLSPVCGAIPYPLEFGKTSLFGCLNSSGLDSCRSFTPGVGCSFDTATANYYSIRGVQPSVVISETERKSLLRQRSGDIKDAQACLELYAKESFPNVIDLVKSRDAPVNVCLPFPTSIVSEYARDNFRSSEKYSHGYISTWSFSGISTAQNTTACHQLLEKLVLSSSGRKTSSTVSTSLSYIDELGVDQDDFSNAMNNLEGLKDQYSMQSVFD